MIVGLSISPNPAQNYIVLSASFPLEVSNVTLISLEGHKITLPTLYRFSKEVGVDISAIKAGLYLLELKHLEGVLRSKIMVE